MINVVVTITVITNFISPMETSKHHTNFNNKQRHEHSTSYRPISLLSVIAKTLEKTLLPCITNNTPHKSTQYVFKSNHSTSTAQHYKT